jgi:hypothetical protein
LFFQALDIRFIPVGIRIGLDAKEKLHADPRDLTVTYQIRQPDKMRP